MIPCSLNFLMSFWLVLLRLSSPRICCSDLLFSSATRALMASCFISDLPPELSVHKCVGFLDPSTLISHRVLKPSVSRISFIILHPSQCALPLVFSRPVRDTNHPAARARAWRSFLTALLLSPFMSPSQSPTDSTSVMCPFPSASVSTVSDQGLTYLLLGLSQKPPVFPDSSHGLCKPAHAAPRVVFLECTSHRAAPLFMEPTDGFWTKFKLLILHAFYNLAAAFSGFTCTSVLPLPHPVSPAVPEVTPACRALSAVSSSILPTC